MTFRTLPRTRLILALFVIAFGALLLGAAIRHQDDAPSAPVPANNRTPVITAGVTDAEDDVILDVVGSGLAARAVTLFPLVAGEVERVLFAAGEHVTKGRVLVQLVDRKERLSVQLAETRVDAATRLLKRYQRTRGTGAVPDSVIDEAQIGLRQAEIELSQAQEQLRDRAVRAPFAGVVGIARVDPGDRVATDSTLTTLDDRSTLSVAFEIPEPFLSRLKTGDRVTLRNVAFPGRSFQGKLAHIDSRVDPATRTVDVRATVPNGDDLLRPGMSFDVQLALPGMAVKRVPELAVQWSREGSHVWVVRDGAALRIPVRVVRRMEGAVLVDGELRADDRVVVEGVQRLRPGRPVNVIEQAGRRAGAAAP